MAAEGGHFLYIYISFSHLDRVKMFQHLAFQTLPTTLILKLTGKLCMQTFSALLRRLLLAIFRLFTVFAHVTAPRCSTTYRHGPTYRGVFLLQGIITTHIGVLCLNRPWHCPRFHTDETNVLAYLENALRRITRGQVKCESST